MIRHVCSICCLVVFTTVGLAPSKSFGQFTTRPPVCNLDLGDVTGGPPDPGVPGPFTVVVDEYGLVSQFVDLPDFDDPVEFLAEVAYPEETECGPFPIVFMMHGGHATCVNADDSVNDNWPCDAGQMVLENYKGYTYLAELLASHGIIAVSISANSINANDATNLEARARLFQRHIGQWLEFSTLGSFDFGDIFLGKVDLKRVGILGHSRGGGAAARLIDLIKTSPSPPDFLSGNGDATKIQAALLVGAVADSEDHVVTETAVGVVLPYCDGDQVDLPSVAYYDASRYALLGDPGPKHSFEVMGANHNFFNTKWDPNESSDDGAIDDWVNQDLDIMYCDPESPEGDRLTSAEQRAALSAIASAFFRTYLRNEKVFRPFLTGEAPPPASASAGEIHVGYHPKDEPEARLDVNRLNEKSETLLNTLGGIVDSQGLNLYYCDAAGAGSSTACLTVVPPPFQGGRAPHYYSSVPANQLRVVWDGSVADPFWLNEIPEAFSEVSGYRALQFRAFVDYSSPMNPVGIDQDLSIVLVDGAGLSAWARVSDHSRALFFPPPPLDETDDLAAVPRAILNTVRMPLSAFDDIFLTDVRSVVFIFDQTASGAINIADIAFADEALNTPPSVSCSIADPVLMPAGEKLENVGLTAQVVDDHDGGLLASINVYSDEDDLDSENKQSSPDAKEIAIGTLRLRAEQDKNEDGRVYLVVVTATDQEGAFGHACCTAVVPAGNQVSDLINVEAQATAARNECTSFAAASLNLKSVPAGFFEVGDGPTIGPHQ